MIVHKIIKKRTLVCKLADCSGSIASPPEETGRCGAVYCPSARLSGGPTAGGAQGRYWVCAVDVIAPSPTAVEIFPTRELSTLSRFGYQI